MDLKTTLSLQNGIFFSIVRLKRVLQLTEDLPIYATRTLIVALGLSNSLYFRQIFYLKKF